MNISLTNRCSRRCEYCFQREWFLEGNGRPLLEMPLEMFCQILDVMHPEGFNLMGGEPLLYSHLFELLDICEERRQNVCMLSNLVAPHDIVARIADMYGCVQGWLVNSDFTPGQEEFFYDNLHYLAEFSDTHISVATTFIPDAEMNKIKANRITDVVDHFNSEAKISVRVSPATPTHNSVFGFYDYTDDMMSFLEHLWKVRPNVHVGFDCPINACEFHPAFTKAMRRRIKYDLKVCNNPPLDFMPDGSVIWCSSIYNVRIPDFRQYKDREEVERKIRDLWCEYWDNHELVCDYKNCGKFGPTKCYGLCMAKNEVLRRKMEQEKEKV